MSFKVQYFFENFCISYKHFVSLKVQKSFEKSWSSKITCWTFKSKKLEIVLKLKKGLKSPGAQKRIDWLWSSKRIQERFEVQNQSLKIFIWTSEPTKILDPLPWTTFLLPYPNLDCKKHFCLHIILKGESKKKSLERNQKDTKVTAKNVFFSLTPPSPKTLWTSHAIMVEWVNRHSLPMAF